MLPEDALREMQVLIATPCYISAVSMNYVTSLYEFTYLAAEKRLQTTLRIAGDGFGPTQAQITQSDVDRCVALLTRHDANCRRSVQTSDLHIPPHGSQGVMAGRGETGEVRHLPTRHEPDGSFEGKAEHVDQPPGSDVFDGSRPRRWPSETGVLIPRRHQPVRRQRGRQRAPDHKPEETASRHRHECVGDAAREFGDNAFRRHTLSRKRVSETLTDLGEPGVRRHGPRVQRCQIQPSLFGCNRQRCLGPVHERNGTRPRWAHSPEYQYATTLFGRPRPLPNAASREMVRLVARTG